MVINGPVANAGSIFRRSSVIGTKRTEDTGEHNDSKQAQGDGSRYPFVAQHKEVNIRIRPD